MARSRDYRLILKNILLEKQEANKRFSLRAFAKHLELTHSALNQVFKGTKNLSPETAAKIARKLKMEPVDREHFCLLVQLEAAKDPELKKAFEKKIKTLKGSRASAKAKVEATFLPEWYHPIIMAMTNLTVGEYTPKTVAKRIGITIKEATETMEQMESVGLLCRDDEGQWAAVYEKTVDVTMPHDPKRTRAIHQTHLQMAAKALDEQPLGQRMNVLAHLAFPKSRIPEAREIAHECLRRMQLLSDEAREEGEEIGDVYAFVVSMFSETAG